MAKTSTAEMAELAQTPARIDIAALCAQHQLTKAMFSGLCAAQGWRPGKVVTDAEFRAALKAFSKAPMGIGGRK